MVSWVSFIISRIPKTFGTSFGDPQTFFDIHGSTTQQIRLQWLHENHCVPYSKARTVGCLSISQFNLQIFPNKGFVNISYLRVSKTSVSTAQAPRSRTPCIQYTQLYQCPTHSFCLFSSIRTYNVVQLVRLWSGQMPDPFPRRRSIRDNWWLYVKISLWDFKTGKLTIL